MDNTIFSNSAASDIDKCVIWQYDKSTNLCGIIDAFKAFYKETTQDFWDEWIANVASIDTATDFGLSVWGNMIGIPRPTLLIDDENVAMSSAEYRKLIKARIKLLSQNASIPAYKEYVDTVFDGKLDIVDTFQMGIKFVLKDGEELTDEQAALIEQYPDVAFAYPSGVRSSDDLPCNVFCLSKDDNAYQPCRTSETRIGSQLDHGVIAWGNEI